MVSTSTFGKTSVSLGVTAVLCAFLFIISGFVLPSFANESVIVPFQMITIFLVPTLSLVGLAFGIPGIRYDANPALAKTGTWLNILVLVLFVLALSFLSIASYEEFQDKSPTPQEEVIKE